MYSKVKIAGHPVHAMLVGLPVGLYVVTFGSYLAYALGAEPFWFRAGVYANVGGVITAALAAVPGFIDWAFGIPAGTPAKRTGLAHMAFNVGALLLFAVDAFLQWSHRNEVLPATGASAALAGLGVVLTAAAGFLGWKLVQTHHVGVELSPEQQRLEPRPVPPVKTAGERYTG